MYYSTREYGVTFYRHTEYKCLLKTTYYDPNWFCVPYLKSLPLPKILLRRYYCKYKFILNIIPFSPLYGWYCILHLLWVSYFIAPESHTNYFLHATLPFFVMEKSSCCDLIRFNEVKYLTDNHPLCVANMDRQFKWILNLFST